MKRKKHLEAEEALECPPGQRRPLSFKEKLTSFDDTRPNDSANPKSNKNTVTRTLPPAQDGDDPAYVKGLRDIETSDDEESQAQHLVPTNDATPKRGRGRPKGSTNKTPVKGTSQLSLPSKKIFSTPVKAIDGHSLAATPKIEKNADRSARRKSTRALIERTVLGHTSDNDEEEEEFAQHVYDTDADELAADSDGLEGAPEALNPPDTPSRKRGRPKGSKNRRSLSPPLAHDLPPHEKYFFQNRSGRPKTSSNNLSALKLLDHDEFFSISRRITDRHSNNMVKLQSSFSECFNQWRFELEQGFGLCFHGWGSKRSLLMSFADYVYNAETDHSNSRIVVVNGYVQTLSIRDILNTVATATSGSGRKLGSQPAEMLESVLDLLEEDKNFSLTLIIHSIDRIALRRPATQTILSRLSAHPQIRFVASADHPSFPLLWDSSLRSAFNFLFHECTTFQPHTAEVDVVDEVHELFGRSGRRVGGKEGVIFVLKSLPENAKNLYKVLTKEQLAIMHDSSQTQLDAFDEDEDDNQAQTGVTRKVDLGVEQRVLYQMAVEQFICSNEMSFRTLLKEFLDHQMVQSKKDALGTEFLSVPFRKEELETILEDIS